MLFLMNEVVLNLDTLDLTPPVAARRFAKLTLPFVNQLGAGMLLPTLLVWSMSILPFEVRGRGTGFWQSAFALGQWLSPITVTFFAMQLGGLMKGFEMLGYMAAAGFAVALAVQLLAGRTGGETAHA